jgi:hypothetical protein
MFMRRGPGLLRAAAVTTVVAGTAGAVRHHQDQKYARQDYEQQQMYAAQQQQYAPPQQYAQPQYAQPAPSAEPDYMAELEQLAQLKRQGVITEDEFQAKKKQLLGI